MNCPCGNLTTSSEHEVKTLSKAREWQADIEESDLPIKIDSDKCGACGRMLIKIYSGDNLIHRRG